MEFVPKESSTSLAVTAPESSQSALTTTRLLDAFAEFLNLDVGSGDASQDTIATYRCQLQLFVTWCEREQVNPVTVTREQIKRYRRFLIEEKKFKVATIALKLSVVRRFYDAAVEKGLLMVNPAVGIKPPLEKRDPAERITFLEKSEVEQLLAAIPNDGSLKAARDKALLGIMPLLGPRTVELHRANLGDLVQQGNNIGIRVEAKRSIRIVPLTPDLVRVLMAYLEARRDRGEVLEQDSPLFIGVAYSSKGKRLSRRGVRTVVDSYLKQTGLKYRPGRTISAHSLRHTAGTLALQSGADLRQVQDLLGHADPRTTSLYAHVADRWENNPALKIGIKV